MAVMAHGEAHTAVQYLSFLPGTLLDISLSQPTPKSNAQPLHGNMSTPLGAGVSETFKCDRCRNDVTVSFRAKALDMGRYGPHSGPGKHEGSDWTGVIDVACICRRKRQVHLKVTKDLRVSFYVGFGSGGNSIGSRPCEDLHWTQNIYPNCSCGKQRKIRLEVDVRSDGLCVPSLDMPWVYNEDEETRRADEENSRGQVRLCGLLINVAKSPKSPTSKPPR